MTDRLDGAGAGVLDEPSAADNLRLIEEFEQGRPAEGFHHADHVRVAFAYVSRFPILEAIGRFSEALRRFAAAKGKAGLYHETITWGYLLLINERRSKQGKGSSWEEFAEANSDLLIWKGGPLERYYSPERLNSDLARKIFVLPDRAECVGHP